MLEQVEGTAGNDTFPASAGLSNTANSATAFFPGNDFVPVFSFVGSAGNDSFTDASGVATGVARADYFPEQWAHEDFDGLSGATIPMRAALSSISRPSRNSMS